MPNELFPTETNRIRGKFATSTHTRLYKSMENGLKSQIEHLRRQLIGVATMLRLKDEQIIQLKQKLKDAKM